MWLRPRDPLKLLLVFVVVALAARYALHGGDLVVFVASALATMSPP